MIDITCLLPGTLSGYGKSSGFEFEEANPSSQVDRQLIIVLALPPPRAFARCAQAGPALQQDSQWLVP